MCLPGKTIKDARASVKSGTATEREKSIVESMTAHHTKGRASKQRHSLWLRRPGRQRRRAQCATSYRKEQTPLSHQLRQEKEILHLDGLLRVGDRLSPHLPGAHLHGARARALESRPTSELALCARLHERVCDREEHSDMGPFLAHGVGSARCGALCVMKSECRSVNRNCCLGIWNM